MQRIVFEMQGVPISAETIGRRYWPRSPPFTDISPAVVTIHSVEKVARHDAQNPPAANQTAFCAVLIPDHRRPTILSVLRVEAEPPPALPFAAL